MPPVRFHLPGLSKIIRKLQDRSNQGRDVAWLDKKAALIVTYCLRYATDPARDYRHTGRHGLGDCVGEALIQEGGHDGNIRPAIPVEEGRLIYGAGEGDVVGDALLVEIAGQALSPGLAVAGGPVIPNVDKTYIGAGLHDQGNCLGQNLDALGAIQPAHVEDGDWVIG